MVCHMHRRFLRREPSDRFLRRQTLKVGCGCKLMSGVSFPCCLFARLRALWLITPPIDPMISAAGPLTRKMACIPSGLVTRWRLVDTKRAGRRARIADYAESRLRRLSGTEQWLDIWHTGLRPRSGSKRERGAPGCCVSCHLGARDRGVKSPPAVLERSQDWLILVQGEAGSGKSAAPGRMDKCLATRTMWKRKACYWPGQEERDHACHPRELVRLDLPAEERDKRGRQARLCSARDRAIFWRRIRPGRGLDLPDSVPSPAFPGAGQARDPTAGRPGSRRVATNGSSWRGAQKASRSRSQASLTRQAASTPRAFRGTWLTASSWIATAPPQSHCQKRNSARMSGRLGPDGGVKG